MVMHIILAVALALAGGVAGADSLQQGRAQTQEVNINGLLIQGFVRHYEKRDEAALPATLPEAVRYFATCKPFLYAGLNYPTLNAYAPSQYLQDPANPGLVVPRRLALGRSVKDPDFQQMQRLYPPRFGVDSANPTISRYAQCRITAHYWLAEAASQATTAPIASEAEIEARLEQVFNEMDANPARFLQLRQAARVLWRRAVCTPWLAYAGDFNGHELDCGVFSYVGDKFTVERRATLSDDALNGRRFMLKVDASQRATRIKE